MLSSLIFSLPSFVIRTFKGQNFSVSAALAVSHKFWYVAFSLPFNSKYCVIFIVMSYLASFGNLEVYSFSNPNA